MNIKVLPGPRHGVIPVPASKSWAHRMLITAALSKTENEMHCDGISKDISATTACLNGLGANILLPEEGDIIKISPIAGNSNKEHPVEEKGGVSYSILKCGESGSTLRFLLPVVGALGAKAVFYMEGRLSERPMGPLVDELCRHGMDIKQEGNKLFCSGKLISGDYNIPGDISSQYISGLLMALPLVSGVSRIVISGKIESADYIEMTARAVKNAGIVFERKDNVYLINGYQAYRSEKVLYVEKDWSSAAFPLCMGAFSEEGVTVRGLNPDSGQGDKEIVSILENFGAVVSVSGKNRGDTRLCDITVKKGSLKGQVIDASGIPDLVPVISAVAAGSEGETKIIHAERLRFKESDRLMTTASMLKGLGADIEETEDGLVIRGKKKLKGGAAESFNDHRIAMSAAVAAGICGEEVEVLGAECTDKSYPGFFKLIG